MAKSLIRESEIAATYWGRAQACEQTIDNLFFFIAGTEPEFQANALTLEKRMVHICNLILGHKCFLRKIYQLISAIYKKIVAEPLQRKENRSSKRPVPSHPDRFLFSRAHDKGGLQFGRLPGEK